MLMFIQLWLENTYFLKAVQKAKQNIEEKGMLFLFLTHPHRN